MSVSTTTLHLLGPRVEPLRLPRPSLPYEHREVSPTLAAIFLEVELPCGSPHGNLPILAPSACARGFAAEPKLLLVNHEGLRAQANRLQFKGAPLKLAQDAIVQGSPPFDAGHLTAPMEHTSATSNGARAHAYSWIPNSSVSTCTLHQARSATEHS